ncbi:hypothetical protein PF003_g9818 [Phytophthora fragariae]|nr:hypothetical protein PF003_g9818 [Phytophthora fragariae]
MRPTGGDDQQPGGVQQQAADAAPSKPNAGGSSEIENSVQNSD